MLCPLKPYLLQESGVGQPGLALYEPVEIILLKMKCIGQVLNLYVGMVLADICGDLLENQPVHGLALVF